MGSARTKCSLLSAVLALSSLAHCGHRPAESASATGEPDEASPSSAPTAEVEVPVEVEIALDVEAARDVERTPAAFTVPTWLARNPEVEMALAYGVGAYRFMRVRAADGSTFCLSNPEGDEGPLCWRDEREIEGVSTRMVEGEVEDEFTLAQLGVSIAGGPIERSQIDLATRRRRRDEGPPSGASSTPSPDVSPFWSGDVTATLRAPDPRFGAWEAIVSVEVPVWLHLFASQDAERVPSLGGAPAIVLSADPDASDSPGGRLLCVRGEGWACGAFDVSRQDWEVTRLVERIEALGERTYVVQSSMRMDGGNGEGSGAYGSSELYVLTVEGAQITVAGFLPLGGMEWTTEQLCDWDEPCYYRVVRRVYHPWSVDAPGCITLSAARAESATADGSFVAVRRAAGRARPIRHLRGRDAIAAVALGFPGDEASGAFVPPTEDLTGTYRWDGSRLARGACSAP